MKRFTVITFAVASILMLGCVSKQTEKQSDDIVLTGLDGRSFTKPEMSTSVFARLDSNLRLARNQFDLDHSEESYVWLGRREAYLYNYHKAIDIFSEGLKRFPESYVLLRHRGHRYITVRNFDAAIADLKRASELMRTDTIETEPDGQPNKLNIPLSSVQFNIWYHLGLAYYLKQDFVNAKSAYEECMKVSINDDLKCATTDWLYMTLRRMKDEASAKALIESLPDTMHIIENDSYYKRLKMYRGKLPVESVLNVDANTDDAALALATQGYGVGNWYLCNGDTTRAISIYEKVVEGEYFSAFGFIASEVDLQLLRKY